MLDSSPNGVVWREERRLFLPLSHGLCTLHPFTSVTTTFPYEFIILYGLCETLTDWSA